MKVFVCTDHDSHYVGGASVIIAENEEQARELLDRELRLNGLNPQKSAYTLKEISLAYPHAKVLHTGDY